jgi:hypothetical protein
MKKFRGYDYRDVAINTRQKAPLFNASGNTASEQKLGECLCRRTI